MKTNKPITMKTKHALCGLLSGLLLLAAGTAQTHAGLLVPAAPGAKLYVANRDSNTILSFTTGGVGSVFANTGLSAPQGLAFDTAGNLFTVNGGSTIQKFTPGGVGSLFASGLTNSLGLAFDSAGDLYAGNHAGFGDWITKFTPSGTASLFNDYNAGLFQAGLAFDNSGNLYSANPGGNTISKFTPAGVRTTFWSGGQEPVGLAFDSAGNLHASNTSGQIRKISSTGTDLGIFANPGFEASGLAFDSAGDLYAALGNNTIRKYSSTGTDLGVFADAADGLNVPTYLAFAPVPEPGTAVFGIACVGVAALRRRRSVAV